MKYNENKGWGEYLMDMGSQRLKYYLLLFLVAFAFVSLVIQPKERMRERIEQPIVVEYVLFTQNNFLYTTPNGKAQYWRPFYKTRYDMIGRNILMFGSVLTSIYLVVRIKENR